MAQSSIFWPTSGVGDGAAQYTDAQLFAWLRRTFLRSITTEGVHAGHLNELACTGAVSPVAVNTGAALVDGIPYENTASVNQTIATPSVGTTGHRIVLRANWAAQTVRITDIASADGVAAIPAAVQIAGTTYDITLATLTITVGGVITLTDARSYLHYTTKVNTAMLDAGAVGSTQLAANAVTTTAIVDNAVTPAKIPNRIRTLWVPATYGWNLTDSTNIYPVNNRNGILLPDAKQAQAFGTFAVPADWDGVTFFSVTSIVLPNAAGNVYGQTAIQAGAVGEAWPGPAAQFTVMAALPVTTNRAGVAVLTPTTVDPGDYCDLQFYRDAVSATDTVNDFVIVAGWRISYTADS